MSIFKAIDKSKIVSFDIFDTLIKRNCGSPHDIFDIVEREINSQGHQVNNFRSNRIEAEKIARQKSKFEEISLDEIYTELSVFYGDLSVRLKELEIENELKFCVRNNNLYDIYEYCKNKGKTIICVSDMYLPYGIVTQILENAGYKIDKIYISSQYRLLKRSKNLFRYVLKDFKARARDVLHIGDSKRSDFLNPKLLGMKSHLVPKHYNNLRYINNSDAQNLDNRVIFAFINNNIDKTKNDYYKIGFELLGPLIYGFCLWLKENVQKKGIEKLFFCARDMLLVQTAYNIIFKDRSEENVYLYVSRVSTKLPYLYVNHTLDDFLDLVTDKKMTIAEIISSMGIKDFPQEIINNYGFGQEEYNRNSLLGNKKFSELYNNEIVGYIVQQSSKQYEFFKEYLNDIGFFEKVGLVDLGWRGTIQHTLAKTFNGTELTGFYFGIEKQAFSCLNNDNFSAYLFSLGYNENIEKKLYVFRSLFEILFSAPHGTTIAYGSGEGNQYLLGENENLNNSYINDIHEGALSFVKSYKKADYDFKIIYDDFLNSLIRIGTNPTYKESVNFGDFYFNNMLSGRLACPDKFVKYIFNWKKLKKDLFRSEWKIGFMKRLFKIKLPYYKIYSFMKDRNKS